MSDDRKPIWADVDIVDDRPPSPPRADPPARPVIWNHIDPPVVFSLPGDTLTMLAKADGKTVVRSYSRMLSNGLIFTLDYWPHREACQAAVGLRTFVLPKERRGRGLYANPEKGSVPYGSTSPIRHPVSPLRIGALWRRIRGC